MAKDRVIVIGGANIDIRARAGAPLLAGTSNPGRIARSAGGVAFNIARNLAKLGVAVSLITVLGDDAAGDEIRTWAETAGIDMSLSRTASGPTGHYVAILDGEGEMTVAVNDMEVMSGLTPDWLGRHDGALAAARFVVADCNMPEAALACLSPYRDKMVIEPVSVAKCGKVAAIEKPFFAATPNRKQAEALTGAVIETIDDALAAARALTRRGIDHVVLTLGGDGAVLAERDGRARHIRPLPSAPTAIFDVTGAGDANVAGIVYALMEDLPWEAAALVGQAAASLARASADTVAPELSGDRLLALAGVKRRMAG